MSMIEGKAELSIIHPSAEGVLRFFYALVTLDVENCERSIKALKLTIESTLGRKKCFLQLLGSMTII